MSSLLEDIQKNCKRVISGKRLLTMEELQALIVINGDKAYSVRKVAKLLNINRDRLAVVFSVITKEEYTPEELEDLLEKINFGK
jgi:hypothetical protein